MKNVKQSYKIELDHIELLNFINSVAFATNLIYNDENTTENQNHLGYLVQLQEKLTNHLPHLSEEFYKLLIHNN